MPRPGRYHGHTLFNKACDSLKRLADRVYKDDFSRLKACRAMVDEFSILVDKEAYDEANYNPFQALIRELTRLYPEVWEGDEYNSGRKIMNPWM